MKLETGLNRTGLAILWTFIANLFHFILKIEENKICNLRKKNQKSIFEFLVFGVNEILG